MDATNMDATNMVVLRGSIVSEPVVRELPSGSVVTQLEVTTRSDSLTAAVPVAVHDRTVGVGQGDEVVVTGHVNRRFFRAGGVTQSRTEVIAAEVIRVSRRKTVARALAGAARYLATEP